MVEGSREGAHWSRLDSRNEAPTVLMAEEGGGGLNRGGGEAPCLEKNGPHARHDGPRTKLRTRLDSVGICDSKGQGGAQRDSPERQSARGVVLAGDENDEVALGDSLDAEDPEWVKRRRRGAWVTAVGSRGRGRH